jgi:hypothetical protein
VSGYQITPEEHQKIYQKFNIVLPSLKFHLETLMKKQRLLDNERAELSKSAYLLDLSTSKIANTPDPTTDILCKTIYYFMTNKTIKQITDTIPSEQLTLDMLNLVVAKVSNPICSVKRIKEYIKLFINNNVYPDFNTFKLLRSYGSSFKSNRHRFINNYFFDLTEE